MAEHPSWDEIRAQLNNARELLAADQRRRSPSADGTEASAPGDPVSHPIAPTPVEAPDTLMRLEALARRRRIEWQTAAARSAMKRGRIAEADAALQEIRELDPDNPEIFSLSFEIDLVALAQPGRRKGPASAAFVAFVTIVLVASRSATPVLEQRRMRELLAALPFPISATFQTVPEIASTVFQPSDTTEPETTSIAVDNSADTSRPERAPIFSPPPIREIPPVENAGGAATVATDTPVSVQPVSTAGAVETPAPVTVAAIAPVAVAPSAPLPVPSPSIDNERSIRQALERYRAAYERLDARSAQQVWPAVDASALARAFTGLRSQSLTFDQCEVQIRGTAATASCAGSARYVPKVGSQQPRIESRLWDFTLRQNGTEWKIESARVDR